MSNIIREPCGEGIILSGKFAAPCTRSQERWILAATILASSMAFIDGEEWGWCYVDGVMFDSL